MQEVDFGNLPDPGDRYNLGDIIGVGSFGRVSRAVDQQDGNKNVAIKIQKYEEFVEEEYKILKDCSSNVNIVDFYAAFRNQDEVWFVLELCDGGTVVDLVQKLLARNRRLPEEHIAYIMKETVKGLAYLHENNVTHRDVRGSNILLTRDGEIKLCDFGLSKKTNESGELMTVGLGSPCWMAPEIISACSLKKRAYDNRVDVWSVGITAIELGDGKAPFQDMHPARVMFQILRNPPPVLSKLSQWSESLHDFISECLVKDPEYRPYIVEIMEHPFLLEVPEKSYHLSLELKSFINLVENMKTIPRKPEVNILVKMLKIAEDDKLQQLYDEDLAALQDINENEILNLLKKRFEKGQHYTFIGDILLYLNPNQKKYVFGKEFQERYHLKSRSDNAPHVYAIADTAFQNALHHDTPQQIILSGESGSGKTTNYLHLIDQLFYLGANQSINSVRIKNAVNMIHSLIHASTPCNAYSTRSIFKTTVWFGKTGKLSGATFKAHMLEKWRVSSNDASQSNYHIFYYIYDGLVSKGAHDNYKLNSRREYQYLRTSVPPKTKQPKGDIDNNVIKYKKLREIFIEMEFNEEQIDGIHAILAAILNLGEISFNENEEGQATVQNTEAIENFSFLTGADEKKISWALTNYCIIKGGNAIRKRNTCHEANEARDVLANTFYARLVDYIINIINSKLQFGKAIFGSKYMVNLLDYFGFECFKQNGLSQLIVNTLNEQLHYHYLQRVFAWEMTDSEKEEIEFTPIKYFSNKDTLNELLGKPEGLLSIIDDASRMDLNCKYISDNLLSPEKQRIVTQETTHFTVAHYTGKVLYNAIEMPEKNRDFLPPEIIETMRGSQNPIVSMLFTNKLDRSGNLLVPSEETRKSIVTDKKTDNKCYSQIKKMRTQASVFRAQCLDLLKELSIGHGTGGTQFLMCIRTILSTSQTDFKDELVRQQIRAMNIVESAKARQQGYSQRINFAEFLKRYKFLAFDFEENVDVTADNCRLLLIRLKMEGWALGKTKIFLKYYNEEYLARLYEIQVRKIIKIQSILRGFLVKCRMTKEEKEKRKECIGELKRTGSTELTEDQAAGIIQKAYRKKNMKNERKNIFQPLLESDRTFIKPFAEKWQKQTIFSVLMRYRSIKFQQFFNLSQQVHLYNQQMFHNLITNQDDIDSSMVDQKANISSWLGNIKPTPLKLRFRLDEIPYHDSSYMCDPLTNVGTSMEKEEIWDSPYHWREAQVVNKDFRTGKNEEHINTVSNMPFSRDPDQPIGSLPSLEETHYSNADTSYIKVNNDKYGTLERNKISKQMDNNNVTQLKNSLSQHFDNSTYRNKVDQENLINSSPANKDFQYIRATPITAKPKYPVNAVNPIAELQNRAKRDENDDGPPFNFQGMLRKTNFKRESMRNSIKSIRRFSLTKDENENHFLTNGRYEETAIKSKAVNMEIMPGLILEGIEVDL